MNNLQLSFLAAAPSSIDINAVDSGVVSNSFFCNLPACDALALRAVDDWVFGLGFTNWKTVIDHAISTGHHELYDSDDGLLGLRKAGYRYAPIPRLPAMGAAYVKQRALHLASEAGLLTSKASRMLQANDEFAHKFEADQNRLLVTVKQSDAVVRLNLNIYDLPFSDSSLACTKELASYLYEELIKSGSQESGSLASGAKSLAAHINKASQVVKK